MGMMTHVRGTRKGPVYPTYIAKVINTVGGHIAIELLEGLTVTFPPFLSESPHILHLHE